MKLGELKRKLFANLSRQSDDIPKTQSMSEYTTQEKMLSYQVYSIQGIGMRESQQDSYAVVNAQDVVGISREGLFAIVADGMGGMQGGEEASKSVVNSMTRAFANINRRRDIPTQIVAALRKASADVYKMFGGCGGSTAVLTMLYKEKLWFFSVGDSGLYLLRNGRLTRLNKRHNCRTQEYLGFIRSNCFSAESTLTPREQAALTEYMGKDMLGDIDYSKKPLPLNDGDVILLCSDGVDGFVPYEKLVECMRVSVSPRDIGERIQKEIVQANKRNQDNYTAIIIRCDKL